MKFLNRSLMTRLVTYFLLLSLITVSIAATVAYVRARAALEDSVFERLDAVASLKEDELSRWVEDQRQDVEFLASLEMLAEPARVLLDAGAPLTAQEEAYAALVVILTEILQQKPNIEELFILTDVGGRIVISTDPIREGEYRVTDRYFTEGRLGTFVQNVYPSPLTGRPTMTISTPLYDADGELVGVLAAHLNLDRMSRIILERRGLGATGETYLVDRYNNFVSEARFGEQEFPRGVSSEGINQATQQRLSGAGQYINYSGERVLGVYHWVADRDFALLAEITAEEAFLPAQELAQTIVLAGGGLVILLAVGVYWFARQIARPILAMTETAKLVAEGDLSQEAPVLTEDELGVLARTFNQMTAQLRDLYTSLEARVAERTRDLERRSTQLEIASQVSREAATIQDVSQLLDTTVNLISSRFDFYHAGIFLVDEVREYAVLRAASSEGGQRMLERGHKLAVGQVGIVGYVSGQGVPRIALDVGEDAVWFDNPYLPDTHSEMGLPLMVRGEVIGVLDVQSTQAEAFTGEDVEILQIVADQLAIAIDNARLLEETRATLRELEHLYGTRARESWRERLIGERPAYQYTRVGVTRVSPKATAAAEGLRTAEPVLDETGTRISVPIPLRQEILGSIVLRQVEGEAPWSAEDLDLVAEVAAQIGLALENARLLEETRRSVERERLVSEISDRLRSSANVETVLQTTISELGRVLGASGIIRLSGAAAGDPSDG